jgi:hypothetical protein
VAQRTLGAILTSKEWWQRECCIVHACKRMIIKRYILSTSFVRRSGTPSKTYRTDELHIPDLGPDGAGLKIPRIEVVNSIQIGSRQSLHNDNKIK